MLGGSEFGKPLFYPDTGASLQKGASPEFSGEYKQAVAGLNRFRSADVTNLQTAKDTSFAISLVGYHLRNIVRERGTTFLRKSKFASFNPEGDLSEQAKKGFQEHISFEPVFTVTYESGNPMLSMRDLGDKVLIETFTEADGISQKEYRVDVPASQDLPLSDVNEEAGTFSNYIFTDAVEWHSAERKDYTDYAPVEHPNSPEQQQGYARILQQVVGKVLDVVPQPT